MLELKLAIYHKSVLIGVLAEELIIDHALLLCSRCFFALLGML